MATPGRAYIVREAGSPSRLGRVFRTYEYTLAALQEAIEAARLRSLYGSPQVVTRVEGRRSTVIRRFERGREVPVAGGPG